MSDTILPKGALRPAEAVVRSLVVDLNTIDARNAGWDDVLEPGFWANLANDLKVGDEVRVLASDRSWERSVRIQSVGPQGAVVQHIDGKQAASLTRQVFLCRERSDAPHMFALYAKEDETWQRLCPGQTSIMALAKELNALITREPNTDFTLSPYDIDRIKELGSDDQAACDTTILLPEGSADGDGWRIVYRDKFGARAGVRNNRRTVGEELRNFFWNLSGNPYGTNEPEWRLVETNWRPAIGDWVLIRPSWNARELWPHCFPKPPAVPREIEEAAAWKREQLRVAVNPQAYRESRRAAQQDALQEFEEMSRAKAEAKAKAEAEAGTP
jgi:hypothetical protein